MKRLEIGVLFCLGAVFPAQLGCSGTEDPIRLPGSAAGGGGRSTSGKAGAAPNSATGGSAARAGTNGSGSLAGGKAIGGSGSSMAGWKAAGGDAVAGNAAGGRGTGGFSTGGAPTGATTSTGGVSAAPNATGGNRMTGGSTAGGSSAGGRLTGGTTSTSGGSASGGTSTNASGGTSTGGLGSGGTPSGTCNDICPFANGITWQCKKRFFYGVNYPWQTFASDFGNPSMGVAATTGTHASRFQTMASNGVSVVRWWVWPNFTGNGVAFSGGSPTALQGSTLADLESALKLADENNLYLQLTLFSFDNFKTSSSPNLGTIAKNATQRKALVDNVVRPFARAAASSAYATRLISWDVINEPEWAVTGASLYGGDDAFQPQTGMTTLTHAEMETLLKEIVAGLRVESQALITVGNAAMKWRHAWINVDQDFYTYHIYDWVQEFWPYSQSPTQYGVSEKPVVMGEFPPDGVTGADYPTLLSSWYTNGYAGALPWQDGNLIINWSVVKAFADAHPCETKY